MSVSVSTPDSNAAKDHEDGHSIKIIDGHLMVLSEKSFPVAAYAPGRWKSAKATIPTEGPGSSPS